MFLGKTLYSHSASRHPGVYIGVGKSPAMDLYPSQEGVEIFLVTTETGISLGIMGHLAGMQIRVNYDLRVLTNCDCKSLVPCKIFNAWSHSKPRPKQQDSLCYGHRYIWSQCSCFSFFLPEKSGTSRDKMIRKIISSVLFIK